MKVYQMKMLNINNNLMYKINDQIGYQLSSELWNKIWNRLSDSNEMGVSHTLIEIYETN